MATAPTPPAKAPTKKPVDPLSYIRENYGFLAGFLAIPEIKTVLLNAAKGSWTPAKLQGAVYGTKWWKTTAEVTRNWTALQSTDPASAKKRIEDTMRQIRTLATGQGVRLDQKQLLAYATQVNKYGWSEQQVAQGVASQFNYNPDKAASGQAALTVDKLKGIASQYLIPVSDATVQKWTRDVIGGQIDADSFVGWAQQQAKSRWPGLADAIDRGVTPEQYTDTYKQTIAQVLETDPDQINLMDAKWSKVIDQVDPKTGARTAMSLSDAATFARKQPEFAKTAQAKQQSAELTSFLGDLFGRA